MWTDHRCPQSYTIAFPLRPRFDPLWGLVADAVLIAVVYSYVFLVTYTSRFRNGARGFDGASLCSWIALRRWCYPWCYPWCWHALLEWCSRGYVARSSSKVRSLKVAFISFHKCRGPGSVLTQVPKTPDTGERTAEIYRGFIFNSTISWAEAGGEEPFRTSAHTYMKDNQLN